MRGDAAGGMHMPLGESSCLLRPDIKEICKNIK